MRLILLHPEVAQRSCESCQQFLYLDTPDRFAEKPIERGGKPVKRQPGQPTPCAWCPKQPPNVADRERNPGTAVELSWRNWQAYRHYMECKAVGQFPDDLIVKQNAAIIRQVEDVAAAIREVNIAALLKMGGA